MQNTIDRPSRPAVAPVVVDEIPFSCLCETASASSSVSGWRHGAGTPHPTTPLSQSRYDGACPYDEFDPWF